MLELFGFIISAVALIWQRKADIVSSLNSAHNRLLIVRRLEHPITPYAAYLRRVVRFVDRHIQTGLRSFFSLLFLSLVYNSVLLLTTWSLGGASIFEIGSGSVANTPQPQRENFAFITIACSLLCYLASSKGRELEAATPIPSVKAVPFLNITRSLISAMAVSIFFYITHSTALTLVIFLACLASCFTGHTGALNCDEEELYTEKYRLQVVISGAFGPVALLMVVLSLVAPRLQSSSLGLVAAGAFIFSGASGVLCLYGLSTGLQKMERMPLATRAPLSMAFYIVKNYTGFLLAITLAMSAPILLKNNASEVNLIALSIILTCCIFLAGARTLAGSGLVCAVVVASLSLALWVMSPDDFFGTWQWVILFWVLIPSVNAGFDFLTWFTSRYFARRILRGQAQNVHAWLALDTIAAYLILCSLAFTIVFMLTVFNYYAQLRGLGGGINVKEMIWVSWEDPYGAGIYPLLMLASTLVPTIGHFVIVVVGGIGGAIPSSWRRKLRLDIRRAFEDQSSATWTVEGLSWRLAAIDHVTGVFLFVALAYFTVKLLAFFLSTLGTGVVYFAMSALQILD